MSDEQRIAIDVARSVVCVSVSLCVSVCIIKRLNLIEISFGRRTHVGPRYYVVLRSRFGEIPTERGTFEG